MTATSHLTGVRGIWHGTRTLADAIAQNRDTADAVARGDLPPVIDLFEPAAPVYTRGRRAQQPLARAALSSTIALCTARGIAVMDVDRGGLGTLHAPGQIVAFLAIPVPVWAVRALCAELLHGIEQLAQAQGTAASSDLGDDVGVWGDRGKIASLGLRVRDGIAQHGAAVNVCVASAWAADLTLCGKSTTRLQNLTDTERHVAPRLDAMVDALARQWGLLLSRSP